MQQWKAGVWLSTFWFWRPLFGIRSSDFKTKINLVILTQTLNSGLSKLFHWSSSAAILLAYHWHLSEWSSIETLHRGFRIYRFVTLHSRNTLQNVKFTFFDAANRSSRLCSKDSARAPYPRIGASTHENAKNSPDYVVVWWRFSFELGSGFCSLRAR